MNHDLLHLAGALARPRARRRLRPSCQASRWAVAAACGDGHGHVCCPVCRTEVATTDLFPRTVLLAVHPEATDA